MKVNGAIITDSRAFGEHYNAYFQSVCSQSDDYEFKHSAVDSDSDLDVNREGVLYTL